MRRWALLLLAVALLPCACGLPGFAQSPARDAVARAVPSAPGHLAVVDDADPVAAAVATSRALFRSSDVAVLAPAGDLVGTLAGASTAVALGVPLLVQPAGRSDSAVEEELDRLGATTVLAVGTVDVGVSTGSSGSSAAEASGGDGRRVLSLPTTASGLAADGVPLRKTVYVSQDHVAAAIAGLRRGSADALQADVPSEASPGAAATEASAPTDAGEAAGAVGDTGGGPAVHLPRASRAAALTDTAVIATGASETWAGLATARAAGALVELTGGSADPRASASVVAELAQAQPSSVLALGAAFAGRHGLAWQLATAETGRQLPGGGQVVFPGRTLVALYGTPGTAALGVLGEQGVAASIQRAQRMAAAYQPLVGGTVVPTFEIIATVASASPGPDGNYSTEIDPARLRPWVQAANDAGVYVILDLQPGRSDFLTQAKEYESLLRMPNVGLALDPEWRLGPGQLPLRQIGSVGIDEINQVVTWLAGLTRQRLLPQKLLVLHQFRTSMIQGRDRLDTSHPELAVALHADGQGGQPSKQSTWATLHQDLPAGPLFWGWKNFYDEDHPMLTPGQTVAQVHPTPQLISYQ